MRELLIFIWANLIFIAWFIAYSNLFHRQISRKKHIIFWIVTLVLTGIGLAGVYWLLLIMEQRAVMVLNTAVGKVWRFIYDLLFLKYIFMWIAIPVAIAFIYFSVRAALLFLRKRSAYVAANVDEQKPWDKNMDGSGTSLAKQPKANLFAGLKRANDKGGNKTHHKLSFPLPAKKAHNSEPDVADLPQTVHFINTDTQKIRYQSLSGVQKAFMKARRAGLQIAEIDAGYFAVYTDEAGRKQLTDLLSNYPFDTSQLTTEPTCAIVTPRTIEAYSLANYGAKLKEESR